MKRQSAAPAPDVAPEAGLVRLTLDWTNDIKIPGSPRGNIKLSDFMAPSTARLLAANLLAAADAAERDPEPR